MVRSFQGLRVVGMLIIFLYHAGVFFDGHLAVSLFFMISGFVIYYNYKDRLNKINIENSFKFTFRKFKKFYIVHFICFLLTIVFLKRYTDILGTVLNLTLLQSFSLNYYFSYNSSSWYLSSMLFCYLFSSFVVIYINKLKKKNNYLVFNIIALYMIKVLCYFIFKDIEIINYWLLYISPLLRIIDFAIGMSLCAILINNQEVKKGDTTNLEILSILGLIISLIGAIFIPQMARMCFYYMPSIILILYVFSLEKGKISKFISNESFLKLANISFEFYMVQEIFLRFFRRIFQGLPILLCKGLQITLSFLVSIILAFLINTYITKFKNSRKNKSVINT